MTFKSTKHKVKKEKCDAHSNGSQKNRRSKEVINKLTQEYELQMQKYI